MRFPHICHILRVSFFFTVILVSLKLIEYLGEYNGYRRYTQPSFKDDRKSEYVLSVLEKNVESQHGSRLETGLLQVRNGKLSKHVDHRGKHASMMKPKKEYKHRGRDQNAQRHSLAYQRVFAHFNINLKSNNVAREPGKAVKRKHMSKISTRNNSKHSKQLSSFQRHKNSKISNQSILSMDKKVKVTPKDMAPTRALKQRQTLVSLQGKNPGTQILKHRENSRHRANLTEFTKRFLKITSKGESVRKFKKSSRFSDKDKKALPIKKTREVHREARKRTFKTTKEVTVTVFAHTSKIPTHSNSVDKTRTRTVTMTIKPALNHTIRAHDKGSVTKKTRKNNQKAVKTFVPVLRPMNDSIVHQNVKKLSRLDKINTAVSHNSVKVKVPETSKQQSEEQTSARSIAGKGEKGSVEKQPTSVINRKLASKVKDSEKDGHRIEQPRVTTVRRKDTNDNQKAVKTDVPVLHPMNGSVLHQNVKKSSRLYTITTTISHNSGKVKVSKTSKHTGVSKQQIKEQISSHSSEGKGKKASVEKQPISAIHRGHNHNFFKTSKHSVDKNLAKKVKDSENEGHKREQSRITPVRRKDTNDKYRETEKEKESTTKRLLDKTVHGLLSKYAHQLKTAKVDRFDSESKKIEKHEKDRSSIEIIHDLPLDEKKESLIKSVLEYKSTDEEDSKVGR